MKKILTLLLCLLCSCNGNEKINNIILDVFSDPEGEILNLSEIATEIVYIPLQITSNALLERVYSIKAKGNFLYINTLDSIVCYDISGKFLFSLGKKGRGPDEYLYLRDFDVNPDNTLLSILSGSDIVIYKQSESGFTFLNKLSLKASPTRINFTTESNNLLIQYSNEDGSKPYSMELISIKGDSLIRWPNYMKYTLKDGYVITSLYENLSYYEGNRLYLKELQNDTLFYMSQRNTMEPFLVFDTKDKRLTPEIRSNGKKYMDNQYEYFTIREIFSSERFLYYTFSYNKFKLSNKIILDMKLNKKYSVPGKENLKDDLIGGINFEPKYCNNGYFYSWVDAITLKNHTSDEKFKYSVVKDNQKKTELKKLAESLSEFDNPVIIVAKIK